MSPLGTGSSRTVTAGKTQLSSTWSLIFQQPNLGFRKGAETYHHLFHLLLKRKSHGQSQSKNRKGPESYTLKYMDKCRPLIGAINALFCQTEYILKLSGLNRVQSKGRLYSWSRLQFKQLWLYVIYI